MPLTKKSILVLKFPFKCKMKAKKDTMKELSHSMLIKLNPSKVGKKMFGIIIFQE